MELDQILNTRRSCRAFTDQKVERFMTEQLIDAALKAPVSCNLQVTQFIVIDDRVLLKKLEKEISYKFSYAPCYILVIYDPRVTVERASVVSSSAMAAQNILLKAVDLGLATCPMAGFTHDRKLKKILSIPSELSLALLISVGYADDNIYKIKIPKVISKKLYSYNSYKTLEPMELGDNLEKASPASIADYRRRIGPVYLDRFRLQTWSTSYYEEVLRYCQRNQIINSQTKSIMDIMTYDGYFLKLLYETKIAEGATIISTDYLSENLDFFKKKFNCGVAHIDHYNRIIHKNQDIQLATMIFQAEFTPGLPKLLDSVYSVLDKEGQLFITTVKEGVGRKFKNKMARILSRYLYRKQVNRYENNKFYRIGPRKQRSVMYMKKQLKDAGFSEIKKDVIKKYPAKGVSIVAFTALK